MYVGFTSNSDGMAVERSHQKFRLSETHFKCVSCGGRSFESVGSFQSHLRDFHCLKEGGSYVCKYGPNSVCRTLPIEGVNERDYADHVFKHHISGASGASSNCRKAPSKTSASKTLSTTSNSSIESLGDGKPWGVLQARINISALLNDPGLVKRELDFFTRTWGEQYETCNKLYYSPVPIIGREDFHNYFQQVSSKLRNRKKIAQTAADTSLPIDVFPALYKRIHDQARQELDEIPKIYMQQVFNLHDIETFNEALPWSMVQPTSRSDKLLQEKLSHYLDIVEVEIGRQVALKSDAFFQVMNSHNELHGRLSSTLRAVKTTRLKMKRLDDILDVRPLMAIGLRRKQSNCAVVLSKLRLMFTIHQAQPTVQLLLTNGDYIGALDLIATTQAVLREELGGVTAFRHLGFQLSEISRLIATMMQQEFVSCVASFLNHPADPGQQGEEQAEEDKLAAIVLGMIRQDNILFVDLLREEASTNIKAIIKQTAIEVISTHVSDDNDGKLPDQLRLLSFSSWSDLVKRIFDNITVALKRIKILCDIIHRVLDGAAAIAEKASPSGVSGSKESPQTAGSGTVDGVVDSLTVDRAVDSLTMDDGLFGQGDMLEEEEAEEDEERRVERAVSFTMSDNGLTSIISPNKAQFIQSQLSDELCAMGDYSNDRVTKVFTAKAKDGFMDKLTSEQFTGMALMVEDFTALCEQICGRRSNSLRGYVQSQASKFVSRFHDEKKKTLIGVLESERWKAIDVPVEFQEILTHIENFKTFAPPPANHMSVSSRSSHDYVTVEGQQYVIVGSVMILLRLIIQYCQCIERIPSLTADMLSRITEILMLFNSRSTHLILGAGALHVAGLKTITTKNLALLSRSLQLVSAYIPVVQSHFSLYLPESRKHQLRSFAQLRKEYSEHNGIILQKLTEIMDQMLDGALKQYEVKAPVPSGAFRTICKNLNKFHETISEVLTETHVRNLFMKVNTLFRDRLRQQLQTLKIHKASGPLQGLVMAELAFYQQNFNSLKGLTNANISASLKSIWT